MNSELTPQSTKLWLIPEFDNLELFRAKAIHYSYARHFHQSYSIGIIEAGIGGNHYRGSTHLACPGSIIFMNPEEAHTGYSAGELPLTRHFKNIVGITPGRYRSIMSISFKTR
jgi:AraC-like DNA-binding protein